MTTLTWVEESLVVFGAYFFMIAKTCLLCARARQDSTAGTTFMVYIRIVNLRLATQRYYTREVIVPKPWLLL